MSPREIDYVLKSVEFVATNGHKFLSLYRYNPKTGEWAHSSRMTKFPGRIWLSNFEFGGDDSSVPNKGAQSSSPLDSDVFSKTYSLAVSILEKIEKNNHGKKISHPPSDLVTYESLRWFALCGDPVECTPEPVGPIQPQRWSPYSSTSATRKPIETSCVDVAESATAYAKQRAGDKLIARTANATVYRPRYLSFQNPDTMIAQVASRNSSETIGIQKHSAVAEEIADTSGSSSSVILPSMSMSAEYPGVNDDPVCMIQRRSLPPVNLESLTEEKVMSGPGATYSAAPGSINIKLLKQPPKKVMKLVGQAVKDWSMIEEGDSLLLGLSGGKDSLALLHALLALQKRAPVRFSIACATVDPQTESFDPSPLIPYLQALGVTYHYLSE